MEHKVSFTIEDLNTEEIYRAEIITLPHIPAIGEEFNFVMEDHSLSKQFYEEFKIKGIFKVLEVAHVYFEYNKSFQTNIVLAFSTDNRFKNIV